jgi:hypothetical protein
MPILIIGIVVITGRNFASPGIALNMAHPLSLFNYLIFLGFFTMGNRKASL